MRVATLAGRFTSLVDSVIFPFEGADQTVGVGSGNSFDPTIKRNNNSGSIKHVTGAAGTASYQSWFFGLQGQYGYYTRRYFQFPILPSSNMTIMRFWDNSATFQVLAIVSGTSHLQLMWTPDGANTLYQIGSDSATVLQSGRWYRIELYARFGSAVGDCSATLRVTSADGSAETVASATGLTITTNMLVEIDWGICLNSDGSQQINSCDGGLNNDQGSLQNSWLGHCDNVAYLVPTADSAVGGLWKTGANGVTNLWNAVKSLPPIGVADGSSTATSQIKNADTTDTTSNYDAVMQTYTAAGLKTNQWVSLVQSVLVIGSSTATDVSYGQIIVSNPAQSGEDDTSTGRGAAVATYGSNWRTYWGTPQIFASPAVGPAPATAPVLRVGRRGTEAGTLEVCAMVLAIEIQPYIPRSGVMNYQKPGIF